MNKHSFHCWETFPDHENDCPQEYDTFRKILPFRNLLLLFFRARDVWGEKEEISTKILICVCMVQISKLH
jgi:hypothetical protein